MQQGNYVGPNGFPQLHPQATPQPGVPNMALEQARLWQLQQQQQQQQQRAQQLNGGFVGQQPNGNGTPMSQQVRLSPPLRLPPLPLLPFECVSSAYTFLFHTF